MTDQNLLGARSEDSAPLYDTKPAPAPVPLTLGEEVAIIAQALDILESRARGDVLAFSNPRECSTYFRLQLHGRLSECFAVAWLDNRHRLIAYEELFYGTVDGCSVHPREVVRAAIKHNACAAIFAHNHPSGVAEPSAADRAITKQLSAALELVGTRVLDHIVIGEHEPVSMAARGLI